LAACGGLGLGFGGREGGLAGRACMEANSGTKEQIYSKSNKLDNSHHQNTQ